MDLTKEQTYNILINNITDLCIKHKYKFTTKTKWNCIKCGCVIYVSYKQSDVNTIFCDDCRNTSKEHTVAQAHYMRLLKEKQLSLIEKLTSVKTKEIEKKFT